MKISRVVVGLLKALYPGRLLAGNDDDGWNNTWTNDDDGYWADDTGPPPDDCRYNDDYVS